jgi:hypothetical protein
MQNQIEKMYAAACRRLGHAELSDTESNGLHLGAYLKENNLPMNEENLYRAIVGCKDILKWKPGKAPKKRGDVQESKNSTRKNHASKDDATWGQGESIVRDAATKADHDKAKIVLREVLSKVQSHCGRTHAITYRQRDQLQQRYDLLVANSPSTITLKQAEAIGVEIRNLQNSFPD